MWSRSTKMWQGENSCSIQWSRRGRSARNGFVSNSGYSYECRNWRAVERCLFRFRSDLGSPPGLENVRTTIQPEVTPGDSSEYRISEPCSLQSEQQFILSVALGMPPRLHENLCFGRFPRNHNQPVTVRGQTRA